MRLMKRPCVFVWFLVIFLLNTIPCPVLAEQAHSKQDIKIAGPEGVAQKLKAEESATSIFPQPSGLLPYDGWKKHCLALDRYQPLLIDYYKFSPHHNLHHYRI